MAPQKDIPKAATVLGTIGTTVGVYRIWKNYRRGSTEGLPGLMLFLWAVCMVPFGAYAVIQNFTIAIQVQPQLFSFLCLICWAQTLFYHNKYNALQASLFAIATGVAFGGVQLLLILNLREPYANGVVAPITFLGVLSAFLLALGLIPPYIELWKHRGRVIGLSFRFLSIDFAGALFSLLALTAQETFDILGGVSYVSVMVLEIGIVCSHVIWLWRTRHERNQAHKAGKDYDEYVNSQDAGDSVFVRIDDVPRDWTRSLRVSAIFRALRGSSDEEKGNGRSRLNTGRPAPASRHIDFASSSSKSSSDLEKNERGEISPSLPAVFTKPNMAKPQTPPTPRHQKMDLFDSEATVTQPVEAHTSPEKRSAKEELNHTRFQGN